MLEYLNHILEQIDPALAYVLLFLSAYVENVVPPIPGDTVTVFGAYLITTGKLGFRGVYISTAFGSVLGFFSMYLLGLKYGRRFLQNRFTKRLFQESHVKKVQRWFDKYGNIVIAANRFLSGTRSIISLCAGIFHLQWWIVLLLSTTSALIWNGLLIYGGYLLGVNWRAIVDIIQKYNYVVSGLTLVFVVALIVYYRLKKKSQRKHTYQGSSSPKS